MSKNKKSNPKRKKKKNRTSHGAGDDMVAVSAAKRSWLTHPTWIIFSVFMIMAAIRILAPSDLYRGDQPKQADYVLDIIVNGNWIVQHLVDGTIQTKPPLYNWLAAPLLILTNNPTDFLLKLPSLIAGLAAALMIWDIARKLFNERVGLYAALFSIVSLTYAKIMYYARTDMLLAMFIVMQIWAVVRLERAAGKGREAYRDSGSGTIAAEDTDSGKTRLSVTRGWLWVFWIAGGLSILTKGPVGLVVVFPALIGWWLWEGRLKRGLASLGVWWGVPVMCLPIVVWVMAIYFGAGQDTFHAAWNQMIGNETVGRFSSTSKTSVENKPVYYYIPYMIARTAPWSILTIIALFNIPWRSFRASTHSPAPDTAMDTASGAKGAVFAAAWLIVPLALFSVIPSKRVDRVFPMLPAMCILAAWVYDAFLIRFFDAAGSSSVASNGQGDNPADLHHPVHARTLSATKWTLIIWIGVMAIGGLAITLLAVGSYFVFDPAGAPADLKPIVLYNRDVAATIGLILGAASLMTIWSYRFRMAGHVGAGLIVGVMMMITFYNHVVSDWAKTRLSRNAVAICKRYREKYARSGDQIIVLRAYPPDRQDDNLKRGVTHIKRPLHYYLMLFKPDVPPDDAAKIIADSDDMVCVFGTRALFDKNDKLVYAGSLSLLRYELNLRHEYMLDTGLIRDTDDDPSVPVNQHIGVILTGTPRRLTSPALTGSTQSPGG